MAMFDADDILYSYGTWSAQDSEEEQSAAAGQVAVRDWLFEQTK